MGLFTRQRKASPKRERKLERRRVSRIKRGQTADYNPNSWVSKIVSRLPTRFK